MASRYNSDAAANHPRAERPDSSDAAPSSAGPSSAGPSSAGQLAAAQTGADLFEPGTFIVASRARPSVAYEDNKRRALAVPALAWQVVIDVRDSAGLHPLRRAVLGLIRCGVQHIDELAHHLALDEALVSTVVQELAGMGLTADAADGQRALTVRGAKQLDDDVAEPQVWLVFSDPWSGALWPRAVRRLEAAELVQGTADEPEPVLNLGSIGRPRQIRPCYLRPPQGRDVAQQAPTPTAVTRALSLHRRAERSHGASEGQRFGSVRRVATQPLPVFLVAEVYLPEDPVYERAWRVACPFGLGDLPWLRRRLDRLRRGGLPLTGVLTALYGKDEPVGDRMALEVAVEERLTALIHKFPTLLEQLIELEAVRATLDGAAAHASRYPHRRRQQLANAARLSGVVLETVLAGLAMSSAGALPPHERAQASLRGVHRALDAARQQLGQPAMPSNWTPEPDRPLCDPSDDRAGLDDLLRLTVAAAAACQTHPLRPVFLQDTSALRVLQETRRWRNQHAHGRKAGSPQTPKSSPRRWQPVELRACLSAVFTVVSAALPHLSPEE